MSDVVLPIHDINPLRRRPVVTWCLLTANVVVFVLFEPVVAAFFGDAVGGSRDTCDQLRFFTQWGAIPKELLENAQLPLAPTGDVVVQQGGPACLVTSPPFEKLPALSVLTSMFLHGSWLHLLGNMLFLGVFGNNVEDRMGRVLYPLFYLACGYAAAYGYAVLQGPSMTPLVGASGAVAGVLGAYFVIFPNARVIGLVTFLFFLPFWLPAWIVLGFWFLLQYIYFVGIGMSAGSNVAYGAHVVGFVVGAVLVLPFVRELRAAGPPRQQAPDVRWVRRSRWG